MYVLIEELLSSFGCTQSVGELVCVGTSGRAQLLNGGNRRPVESSAKVCTFRCAKYSLYGVYFFQIYFLSLSFHEKRDISNE